MCHPLIVLSLFTLHFLVLNHLTNRFLCQVELSGRVVLSLRFFLLNLSVVGMNLIIERLRTFYSLRSTILFCFFSLLIRGLFARRVVVVDKTLQWGIETCSSLNLVHFRLCLQFALELELICAIVEVNAVSAGHSQAPLTLSSIFFP